MIDAIDNQLILLLEKDGQQSSEELAKHLHISPRTVRRRIKNLVEKGVMNIVAISDPDKVGLPVAAIITLDIDNDKVLPVVRTLSKLPPVRWAAATTGRFDAIILARFASTEELTKFLHETIIKIEGIRNIETFVCLHIERKKPKGLAFL